MQPPHDVDGYLDSIGRSRHEFPDLRVLTGVEFGQPHLDRRSRSRSTRGFPDQPHRGPWRTSCAAFLGDTQLPGHLRDRLTRADHQLDRTSV